MYAKEKIHNKHHPPLLQFPQFRNTGDRDQTARAISELMMTYLEPSNFRKGNCIYRTPDPYFIPLNHHCGLLPVLQQCLRRNCSGKKSRKDGNDDDYGG